MRDGPTGRTGVCVSWDNELSGSRAWGGSTKGTVPWVHENVLVGPPYQSNTSIRPGPYSTGVHGLYEKVQVTIVAMLPG